MSIQAPEYVRKIAPYQAGKPISELAREYGLRVEGIVKLASNENPLGIPESARAAMVAVTAELARYPDSNGFELKAAISRRYAVPQDWITLGNGSNDVLELAAHALLQPGASAVYSKYSFAVYALATQETGARAIVVPARDLGHDLEAMRAAITADTRMAVIANPNNPPAPSCAPGRSRHSSPRCRATWWWCWTRPTTSTSILRCVSIPRSGCATSPT